MDGCEIEKVRIKVLPDGRLDTKNAALFTGLSPKTMAMLRTRGTGPSFTKRGRVFYYIDELSKWLKGAEASSTSQSRAR